MKKNCKSRRRDRLEEAIERNEAWTALSYKEQLGILKNRPGSCKKQITRIREKMND